LGREFQSNATRADLKKLLGIDLKDKKVLLTVGRLVRRKGVGWFIKNVLPKLGNEYVYVVTGEGVERQAIEREIKASSLQNRVFLLGRVAEETKTVLLNTADLFIMPNIPVKGDIEGFGIVAIEAAAAGLPVVASNVDGIASAVRQGRSGVLVDPVDAEAMLNAIDNANISKFEVLTASQEFHWSAVTSQYLGAIK